jgi:signal peptide peptidase SppA
MKMKINHKHIKSFFQSLHGQILAIDPNRLEIMRQCALSGNVEDFFDLVSDGVFEQPVVMGSVGILPIRGILSQRSFFASSSIEVLKENFRKLSQDPGIKTIILDINSPGGAVAGIPEFGEEIFKSRGKVKIIAVSNSLAASAAYWLGSQADEFVAMPSSQVGSVGVILTHFDFSEMEKNWGIKTTIIQSGRLKSLGHPSEPLSDEAIEHLQKDSDAIYEIFVAAVARGRGVSKNIVKNNFGEARVVFAKEALENGMIDRIATFDDTLQKASKTKNTRRGQDVVTSNNSLHIKNQDTPNTDLTPENPVSNNCIQLLKRKVRLLKIQNEQ